MAWICLSCVAQIQEPEASTTGDAVREQEAPLLGEASASAEVDSIRQAWQLAGVKAAIREGFLGIAWTLSERLMETPLEEAARIKLFNYRLQISLSSGQFDRSLQIEEDAREANIRLDPLLTAYLAFFKGEIGVAERELQESLQEPSTISSASSWEALLEGLIANARGRQGEANEAFVRAIRETEETLLPYHFETVRLREALRAGPVSEESISALRESVRSMRGERGGFEAARLLAISLVRNGRESAAIDVINTHLTLPGLREFGLRPTFLLLIGMIAGPETQRGQLALRQLIMEAEERETLSLALTLLVQALGNGYSEEAFLEDLATWLDPATSHPLEDRLLAYRAYLLMNREAYEEAERVVNRILEDFPTSTFINDGLRMVAFASWSQNPPRYRTAADFLTRLRDRLPEGSEKLEVGMLIADCYYLNGDFTSASDAYGAVFDKVSSEHAGTILFQRVLSEIRGGRSDAAVALLDAARFDERIDPAMLWRAEWNLIDSWRREGAIDRAFSRIEGLRRANEEDLDLPGELELRMLWLGARLSLEAGAYNASRDKAVRLRERLNDNPFSLLDPLLLEAVESHLLLLIGQADFFLNEPERARTVFRELRERFPQSGPAILSYLFESRQESEEDNLVSAQQSLIGLVDRFPESEFAPIALWEAALNAEKRGLNVHLREAISILERLVSEYPEHGLVYFSRLKQGDLARRLNDFPTALILYERLLTVYPGHPQRYRAEMSRADCLSALGTEDPSRYDAAIVIYERTCLLPAAPPPVRIEAGFKWAQTLIRVGDGEGAEAVFWLLYERFLRDSDLSRSILLEEGGRYWMARSLFELARLQEVKKETASAISILRRIVAMKLPGRNNAASRIQYLEENAAS